MLFIQIDQWFTGIVKPQFYLNIHKKKIKHVMIKFSIPVYMDTTTYLKCK